MTTLLILMFIIVFSYLAVVLKTEKDTTAYDGTNSEYFDTDGDHYYYDHTKIRLKNQEEE